MIEEFKVNFNQEDLKKIYKKVTDYPWSSISNFDHWQYGTSHSYLKKISDYWVTEFNWQQVQNKINSFSNFKTNVDGINIHFIKEEGSGTNPKPLLLMHGWPGSINFSLTASCTDNIGNGLPAFTIPALTPFF